MHQRTTPLFFLGSMSAFALVTFDLYQPSLPAIVQYFETTYALGQLTFSLYLFVFGLSQLIWGPLVDHFGRRRVLPVSLILFLLATIACIVAQSITMLIIARAIQGFSACCASVVSISSTRDCDDSAERARLISYISMIVSASPVFAPLIGSIIFIHFGWQANFILMALFGIYLMIMGFYVLSESPRWLPPQKRFLLTRWIKAYKEMLTHRRLWIGIISITAAFSMLMALVVNAAYLIIEHLNLSPVVFSILFGINGSMIILGNYVGIKLREYHSLVWNIRLGYFLLLLSAVLMVALYLMIGLHILTLMPALFISLSCSIATPPALALTLSNYSRQAATATAMINTSRMSLSAVVAGSIGSMLVLHVSVLFYSLLFLAMISYITSFFFEE